MSPSNDNRTIPEQWDAIYRRENREMLVGVIIWGALLGLAYVIVRMS